MNYYLLKMNEKAKEPYIVISGSGPAKMVFVQHLVVGDITAENAVAIRQCDEIKNIAIETENFKIKTDKNGRTDIRRHLFKGGLAVFAYENREYQGRATFYEKPLIIGEDEYGELEEIGSFTITSPEGKQKTFPLEPLDEEHIIENIHCNLIKFAAILYD